MRSREGETEERVGGKMGMWRSRRSWWRSGKTGVGIYVWEIAILSDASRQIVVGVVPR